MSTDFSTGYDAIVARIATLLPDHHRLPDAKALDKNPDTFLKQGWGWGLAEGGQNTFRFLSCKLSMGINFTLAITRKSFALELDPVKASQAEKDLLEDLRAILTDIEQNNFNIAGSPLLKLVDFSGVLPVKTESDSYLSIVINVNAEFIF